MRFLILLFLASSVYASDTTRYEFFMGGKVAGKHLKWSSEPNHYGYHFDFNDRGRGPSIDVAIVMTSDGIITSRIAKGNDYYKSPVEETYTYSNGVAQWKNHIENDKKSGDGKALYSPLNMTPSEIEFHLKALLKAPNHQLDVLPSGKLKATHIKNHSTKLNGLPIELELYSFSGPGGPPYYLWFTPGKEFFAQIAGWANTILAGHGDLVDELKKLQDDLEQEYFDQQVEKLTEIPTGPVAIKNVNVLDVVNGKLIKGQTVVIDKGKITQIEKAKTAKVPASAIVIDGANKTLMPGLWDNHAHYDITQGLYHLAAGVTNIKDMGNSLDLPDTKKKIDTNELLGPEISVMSGFIDFAGLFAGPTGKIVSTLDEAFAAVDYYSDKGYQQIKLYSSIPVEWVKPLIDKSHQKKMKVLGHIPSGMTAEKAVKEGYDELIHVNMLLLNFMGGDTIDTRSMGRFTKVAERGGKIDVEGPQMKQFVSLLKEKNIVVEPTLAVFEAMWANKPGQLAAGYDAVAGSFPAEFKRNLYYGGLPGITEHYNEYMATVNNSLKIVKKLYDGGVPVVPGTDDFPGFVLHHELELFSKAGIPNVDVLRSATITSAKVAGKDKEVGTVEVGKTANLVLIDGDPLTKLSDIRRVELTIKNGNLYDSKALYTSYGFGFWK